MCVGLLGVKVPYICVEHFYNGVFGVLGHVVYLFELPEQRCVLDGGVACAQEVVGGHLEHVGNGLQCEGGRPSSP